MANRDQKRALSKPRKVFLGTYIPPAWKDHLDTVAADRAMSTSALVCSILRSYINAARTADPTPPARPSGVWPVSKPAGAAR